MQRPAKDYHILKGEIHRELKLVAKTEGRGEEEKHADIYTKMRMIDV